MKPLKYTAEGHSYDEIGICVFCDRCDDPGCCPLVPCDQRAIAAIHRMLEKYRGKQ